MHSRKTKDGIQPGKLPNYFLLQSRGGDQDGGKQRGRARGSHTQVSPSSHSQTGHHQSGLGRGQAYTPPSASSSPAKSRQKMNSPAAGDLEVSLESSMDDTRELQDSITDFPTANMPVMDTMLKDMLVSLRSTLHANILALTRNLKVKFHQLMTESHMWRRKWGSLHLPLMI